MSETLATIFGGASINGGSNLTIANSIAMLLITFVIGIMISCTYMFTYQKKAHSQSFVITVVMLPAIIATIVMFIGTNLASAFSLSGAFALIRFRNTLSDVKDITYIFFAVATGLAVGVSLTLAPFALLFAVVLCLMMILLKITDFGKTKMVARSLRITIPESMHFKGAFDDVFEKYDVNAKLRRVKTVDLGSLYELTYMAEIKEDVNEKDFIDDLRCRNGNLNIVLMMRPDNEFQA